MPKDLTKLSLKDLDRVSDGELDQRMRWNNGMLELTVEQSSYAADDDESDD